jgi:hypothetical protein
VKTNAVEGADEPTALDAVTANEYDVPADNPVTTQERVEVEHTSTPSLVSLYSVAVTELFQVAVPDVDVPVMASPVGAAGGAGTTAAAAAWAQLDVPAALLARTSTR